MPSDQRIPIYAGMLQFFRLWGPALLLMAVIFSLSSIPSEHLPGLGEFDFSIKKLGHATGYAFLALAYRRGLAGTRLRSSFLAWLMAVLYAVSDEYHQSFVPGRGARVFDVGIDALGAGIGLWLGSRLRKDTMSRMKAG